jgi:hypothetical protein
MCWRASPFADALIDDVKSIKYKKRSKREDNYERKISSPWFEVCSLLYFD